MLSNDIKKHAGEFAKAIKDHKYEVSESGIMFPSAKVKVGLKYTHFVNGKEDGFDLNLVPAEGLLHALNVALFSTAKVSTWYVAPYSGNATPTSGWTAANFAANATENVSLTEGFTQNTRQAFVSATAVAGAISNTASPASFTIATATSVTFYGLGLLSTNTRGGTSGVLISATRFTAAKILTNGDTWSVIHEVDATST